MLGGPFWALVSIQKSQGSSRGPLFKSSFCTLVNLNLFKETFFWTPVKVYIPCTCPLASPWCPTEKLWGAACRRCWKLWPLLTILLFLPVMVRWQIWWRLTIDVTRTCFYILTPHAVPEAEAKNGQCCTEKPASFTCSTRSVWVLSFYLFFFFHPILFSFLKQWCNRLVTERAKVPFLLFFSFLAPQPFAIAPIKHTHPTPSCYVHKISLWCSIPTEYPQPLLFLPLLSVGSVPHVSDLNKNSTQVCPSDCHNLMPSVWNVFFCFVFPFNLVEHFFAGCRSKLSFLFQQDAVGYF